jgi:hypothetical protein
MKNKGEKIFPIDNGLGGEDKTCRQMKRGDKK